MRDIDDKPFVALLFAAVSSVWTFGALTLVTPGLNCAVAAVPALIAFWYYREVLRALRLGFCTERVREVGEERTQQALEWLENERRRARKI